MPNDQMTMSPIGHVRVRDEGHTLQIDEAYRPGLQELEGFSHIHVLWWCNQVDTDELRSVVACDKPYIKAPDKMGIFATRSPVRPNPIALTPVPVLAIDRDAGTIRIPYIDAEDHSPIVDLKPYHPAVDRIRDLSVPSWCQHWPEWYEDSAAFDWGSEFVNAR